MYDAVGYYLMQFWHTTISSLLCQINTKCLVTKPIALHSHTLPLLQSTNYNAIPTNVAHDLLFVNFSEWGLRWISQYSESLRHGRSGGGSNPGKDEIFRVRPDQPRTPRLQGFLPRSKTAGAWTTQSYPSPMLKKEQSYISTPCIGLYGLLLVEICKFVNCKFVNCKFVNLYSCKMYRFLRERDMSCLRGTGIILR